MLELFSVIAFIALLSMSVIDFITAGKLFINPLAKFNIKFTPLSNIIGIASTKALNTLINISPIFF